MSLKYFLYAWQPYAKMSASSTPKKGFDSRDVVRSSLLLHTAGSPQKMVNVLVGKGVPGSSEDPCLSAPFPEEEEKDCDQPKALKGGLKPPTMQNGMYSGSRETGTGS